MSDVVDRETRSRMMSGIRSKDTNPELLVRSHLHKLGFRFRLHNKNLPGKPDIVLKKYNAVIFIHGCFWHRHQCYLFKWPKTRSQFWREKINKNYENDLKALRELSTLDWRVCIIWECAIRRSGKDVSSIINKVSSWLLDDEKNLEISG